MQTSTCFASPPRLIPRRSITLLRNDLASLTLRNSCFGSSQYNSLASRAYWRMVHFRLGHVSINFYLTVRPRPKRRYGLLRITVLSLSPRCRTETQNSSPYIARCSGWRLYIIYDLPWVSIKNKTILFEASLSARPGGNSRAAIPCRSTLSLFRVPPIRRLWKLAS